jgi:hypothetical protein
LTDPSTLRLAYHEAADAVVANAFGWKLYPVSIARNVVTGAAGESTCLPPLDGASQQRAAVALAGELGAIRAGPYPVDDKEGAFDRDCATSAIKQGLRRISSASESANPNSAELPEEDKDDLDFSRGGSEACDLAYCKLRQMSAAHERLAHKLQIQETILEPEKIIAAVSKA